MSGVKNDLHYPNFPTPPVTPLIIVVRVIEERVRVLRTAVALYRLANTEVYWVLGEDLRFIQLFCCFVIIPSDLPQ